MSLQKRLSRFSVMAVFFFIITVSSIVDSGAQTVSIGENGHSFCTDSLGINHGPNPKRLAMMRWYIAMNSSANFDVPRGATGIAFDGANIWTAIRHPFDTSQSFVMAHRANNGQEVVNVNTDTSDANACLGPVSLAYDGRFMWCACRDSEAFVRLNGIDGSLIDKTALPAGSIPVFIEFVGNRMWISSHVTDTVSVYNTNTLNEDFSLSVTTPYGMATDGTNMWVANFSGSYVTVFNLDNPYSSNPVEYTVDARSIDIAYDGANMWISHYHPADGYGITILKASDGTLVKKLTASDGVKNKPTYMVFDGVYVWVTNEEDGSISAFQASDFTHAKTVNAGGSGSNSQQIAFDGANIWVANSGSDTVQSSISKR